MIKIAINVVDVSIKLIMLDDSIDEIIGKISVISTSKIRKIILIKKNCNENGKRAEFLGSNPHSNGDVFSRSENDFLEIVIASIIIKLVIIRIVIDRIIKVNIIYTIYRSIDWKSIIIVILYKYLPHQ